MNHPWKFDSWARAFVAGLIQMTVILSLEIVNLYFIMTVNEVSNIIINFLALLIISDFDDYLFKTMRSSPFG